MSRASDEELERALTAMQAPCPLLKFGSQGRPKFRKFWLSADLRILHWVSPNKRTGQCIIHISDIVAIKFGQRTEKFQRNRRPDLEHLSFSLFHKSLSGGSTSGAGGENENVNLMETLDLVCKDEKEWTMWTQALTGLHDGTIPEHVLEKVRGLQTQTKLQNEQIRLVSAASQSSAVPSPGEDHYQVFIWGCSSWGQAGHGDGEDRDKPEIVQAAVGKGVKALACGWAHTAFLTDDGKVYCFGNRTGTALETDASVPLPLYLPPGTPVLQLACGSFHTLALTEGGAVYSWGANANGQLGHDDLLDRSQSTLLEKLPSGVSISYVACGGNSSALIDAEGYFYTFGCGDIGVLGLGSERDALVPTRVSEFGPDNPLRSVAIGDCHMLGVSEKGLYSWGWNSCGQLGLSHFDDQWCPQPVEALFGSQICSASAGAAHSCIIVQLLQADQQEIYSFGANSAGQLGLPNSKLKNVCKPTLVKVPFSASVVQIDCGSYHTAVLTDGQGLWVCGSNAPFGQLGVALVNESFTCSLQRVKDLRKTDIRQVCCGSAHTAVLVNESWVDDQHCTTCMQCKVPFTHFKRRHHCRACGGIFCSSCSSRKAAILKKAMTTPQRVCDACFAKLSR